MDGSESLCKTNRRHSRNANSQPLKSEAKSVKPKPGLEGLVPSPKPVRDIKQVWTDYKKN